MRYANSLESLDSVSSSIQQARAYSRHTVSKNSQISVIYDEGIQQFLPKKLKLTLFFWKIIVPKSQHFVLWYYFLGHWDSANTKTYLRTYSNVCYWRRIRRSYSAKLCVFKVRYRSDEKKKWHSLCQILPSPTIYKLLSSVHCSLFEFLSTQNQSKNVRFFKETFWC